MKAGIFVVVSLTVGLMLFHDEVYLFLLDTIANAWVGVLLFGLVAIQTYRLAFIRPSSTGDRVRWDYIADSLAILFVCLSFLNFALAPSQIAVTIEDRTLARLAVLTMGWTRLFVNRVEILEPAYNLIAKLVPWLDVRKKREQ